MRTEPAPLVRASRLAAKVDSAAVQGGFDLYHHAFILAADGSWTVVQQGMNDATRMARRYHWLMPTRFDADPHAAVAGETSTSTLNLVAAESESNQSVAVALAREEPDTIGRELVRMRTLEMPRHHAARLADLHPERIERVGPRSGFVFIRARRQGRHAVPGRPGNLRRDDRIAASCDRLRPRRQP